VALVLFLGVVVIGLAPSADGDVWWHLAAAREMVRTRALLTTDPFSVSAGGRPWANVHWLFQLGLYGVYQRGGLTALVWAKCLLVGAGALMLFTAVTPKKSARTGTFFACMFIGALFCVRQLLLVRPVIFTLVFLAAFFLVLERSRRDRNHRALWALPLLQILWANCQGLFALGPALVGAYALAAGAAAAYGKRAWFPFAPESPAADAAKSHFRSLALAFACCGLACFVTPYGTPSVALPAKLFSRLLPTAGNLYTANVAEDLPPFAMDHFPSGPFWHLPWFLGLLVFALASSGRRWLLSHVLVVAGFVALALMSNRNVLLLYWVATPIASLALAPGLHRLGASLPRYRGLWVAEWMGHTALLAMLLTAAVAAAREPTLAEPAPFRTPVESAKIIAGLPGEGTVFCADHHGGYLIWSLYPRFRPYIDTRLVLRTPAEFAEYLEIADTPERFDAFQRAHDFAYVVLPVAYPDRYLGLIAHLDASPDWKVLFTDGTEVLFGRRTAGTDGGWDLGSPATTDRVLAVDRSKFRTDPRLFDAARIHLATLDMMVGEFREAERILADAPSPEAHALRARGRLASGNLRGAEEIGDALLRANGSDTRALDVLAVVHARRGEALEATSLLRRALSLDPYDIEATSLLANMEEHHANP
jgi:hypothetical protein